MSTAGESGNNGLATGDAASRPLVLVVDDDAHSRTQTTQAITALGARAVEANGGRMVVSMCELPGARFDLVLMDLAMPDLDGYVATTEIRRLPGCRDLPIVGWSSRVDSRAKDAALAAGMNDLVERRYDADSVAAVIRRWIAT